MADKMNVEIVETAVEPNDCSLFAPLSINMKFRCTNKDVSAATADAAQLALQHARGYWEFTYIVDLVYRKERIHLGRSEEMGLGEGEHTATLRIEGIPFEGIPRQDLNNVSMLEATLWRVGSGEDAQSPREQLAYCPMVVQVTQDSLLEGHNGELTRIVYAQENCVGL